MGKDRLKQTEVVIKKSGVDELLDIMSNLDEATRKQILITLDSELTEKTKKQALGNVKKIVEVTDTETRDWLVKGVSTSYIEGMEATDVALKTFGIKVGKTKLTIEVLKSTPDLAPHLQAVNALISEAYLDFGVAMNGVVKGAERIFNDALKRQARAKILEGRLTGASIREISKTVQDLLGQQGFSVLLDRGGRQWTLKRYSNMLSRTHIIRANTEATVNRMIEFGVDIVEVSDHGDTDAICNAFAGKIYSLSGKSDNYPHLEVQPPFHPNCKHTLLPRPDLE